MHRALCNGCSQHRGKSSSPFRNKSAGLSELHSVVWSLHRRSRKFFPTGSSARITAGCPKRKSNGLYFEHDFHDHSNLSLDLHKTIAMLHRGLVFLLLVSKESRRVFHASCVARLPSFLDSFQLLGCCRTLVRN
ncbi:unnamed protein product [Scytosiphon promiscuus]